MNGFRRWVAFGSAGVALTCVGATGARAVPAVPGGQPFEFSAPAGEFCDFALAGAGRNAALVRPASPGGDLIATGPVALTVTNLETRVSRSYNISGPTFVDAATGRLILTGNALVGQPASNNAGSTFLVVTAGRWVFTPQNTVFSSSGTIANDICAELG
ncbi:hypothetical protein [Kribbella sp. NPDC050459]|uniref:hypothetical protein n=1 Tax=Kribbella sp. NPDC050459 TaxID=3155785 RepID=UPI00340F9D54